MTAKVFSAPFVTNRCIESQLFLGLRGEIAPDPNLLGQFLILSKNKKKILTKLCTNSIMNTSRHRHFEHVRENP
jgi:hypothetical protein